MLEGQRVLAVIPARGGSKGVPGKNLRIAGGKPLIGWSIDAAKNSRYVDRAILSSDDDAIIEEARRLGCEVPYVRSPALAADDTPTIDVVLDALEHCPGFDWVVLLQPTSPLRTAQDVDRAIERCAEADAPACVSVCQAREHPHWMFQLDPGMRLTPLMPEAKARRRQDLPPVYALNGAIYVARTDWLVRERRFLAPQTIAYEMPAERSVDIDTEFDFLQLQSFFGALEHVSLSPAP